MLYIQGIQEKSAEIFNSHGWNEEFASLRRHLIALGFNEIRADELLHYQKLLLFTYAGSLEEEKSLLKHEYIEVAREHAFKLLIAFGTYKKAIAYLTRYEKSKSKKSLTIIHDACLFSFPTIKGWDLKLWRSLINHKGPVSPNDSIFSFLPFAEKMEAAAKDNEQPLTPRVSFEKLRYFKSCIAYRRADENNFAANLFLKYGMPEEFFNEYLSLEPSKESNIPSVDIDGAKLDDSYKDFYLRKLSSSDPHAAILGKLTSCCQSLDTQKAPVVHGITDPNGGFYVLYKNGEIVAQTWAWLSKEGYLAFDSVESQFNFGAKNPLLISDFYVALANELVTKHSIARVLVGTGGQTPGMLGVLAPFSCAYPDGSYQGYKDSRNQRLIADKSLPLIKLYKEYNPLSVLIDTGTEINHDLRCEWINLCLVNNIYPPYISIEVQELKKYRDLIARWQKAAFTNKLEFSSLKKWIEQGLSIHITDEQKRTPLHLSILLGNKENVAWLLAQGANFYARDKEGQTILHYAMRSQSLAMIDFVLEMGVPVDVPDNEGLTCFHLAARYSGMVKIIVQLREKYKININFNGSIGTVFDQAILAENWQLVQKIIEWNLVDLKTQDHLLALNRMVSRKQWLLVYLFLTKYPNLKLENQSTSLVLEVASYGEVEPVKFLIAYGVNIDGKGTYGQTIAHEASSSGSVTLLRTLVENYKLRLDEKDSKGNTVLHYALNCYEDIYELLDFLFKTKSIDINAIGSDGTVLHKAAFRGDRILVDYLINKGANIYLKDKLGRNILHEAITSGELSLVEYLINLGLDPDEKDTAGNSPRDEAVQLSMDDIVDFLSGDDSDSLSVSTSL